MAERFEAELWRARFEDYLKVRYSQDTVNNYRRGLAPFLEFVQASGLTRLSEVTADFLEGYRTHLFYRRHPRTGQSLSLGTQVAYLLAVKVFFRFASREGLVAYNPAAQLDLPSAPKVLPRVLSEAEVLQLLETPDVRRPLGIRDRALVELLYGTALRNHELCALKLDQLELSRHLVRVPRGKGGKGRVVPLGEEAEVWLQTYLVRVRPQLVRNPALTHVFVDRWGQAGLQRAALTAILRKLTQASGLGKRVTPHTLRHSCATHMLRRGAGLRQLQTLLGHASLESTEHYTRVELSDLRKTLRRCHPREREHS